MPLMTWATHVLQWTEQKAARPQGLANPTNLFSVRIAVCNSTVKLESLVIADQHAAVNTFPGFTHRPSHHEFATPEVGEVTFMEPAAEGGADDWGEVVTR